MLKSNTYIATPPGATIKEQLEERELSQKEFAARMAMSEKHISRLINGAVQLTPDVALRLEMVLGVPAAFWNNLEAIYRDKLARAKDENEMNLEIELAKRFPYAEMANNGWVPVTKKPDEKVINLRKYFEVARLRLVLNKNINCIAYRKLAESTKSDYALIAWAQRAKIEAREICTNPTNLEMLGHNIPEIRLMTTENPCDFCPRLKKIMADCGIALVFLPHIGGSFLHGATFYDANKIIVGLTVRGKDADKFWFSMFHEIGHILLGHINNPGETTEEEEREADAFAKNSLISQEQFDTFVEWGVFSRDRIKSFAESLGIAPGIVVGRLQKEGYINYNWMNDLKTQYVLTANG